MGIGLIITIIFAFIGWVLRYLDGKKHDKHYADLKKQYTELRDKIEKIVDAIGAKPIEKITNEEGKMVRIVAENRQNIPENQLSAHDYFIIAYTATMDRDDEKAISQYTKAIELKPDYAEAYNGRGLANFALPGYIEQSISDYQKAIYYKPNFSSAYYNLASAYYSKGDYKSALISINKAIDIEPNEARYYFERWPIYENLAELETYKEKIEEYRKLAEKDKRKYQKLAFEIL